MDKGGMTVAVLGCGPDVAYPPENEKLQRKVAEHGLLITEHPPGIKPLRHYFPARNRILSGLSDAVIITESANKSGTLITAGFAADQGRDVYAVPGSILSNSSAGCHSLIKDGAILIESADEALTGRNCELRNLHSNPINENIKISEITVEAKIIQALLSMSLSLDQLTEETAESVESLSAVLTILELNGKVTCHRGRYFLTDTSSCCI
jgi:DNA processing protein